MIVAGILVLITGLITYLQAAQQQTERSTSVTTPTAAPTSEETLVSEDMVIAEPSGDASTIGDEPPRDTLFTAPQMTVRVPSDWNAQRKQLESTTQVLIQTPQTYTPQPASILIEYGRSYQPQDVPPIYSTKTLTLDNKRIQYSTGRRVLPPLDRRGTQGRTLQERLMTGKSNGQSFSISATYFSEAPIDALDRQLFEIMSSVRFDSAQ